jgi:type I restriction enzyme S subunit
VEDNTSNEIIELGSLVNTINGVSYKSTELNPSTTAMVSLKSFDRNGGFRIDGFKEFTGKYKEQQIVKEGDLIVAHTDITQDAEVIGNPALVISNPIYTTMVISMDMVKVIPKVDWISIEFLYFLMRTREFKGHCEGNANGSTVLHLSKQAIPTYEFKTPRKELVIEFTKQSKELLSKSFENHKQIRTLTQLRDTLLPKLMSGEVRVNN